MIKKIIGKIYFYSENIDSNLNYYYFIDSIL